MFNSNFFTLYKNFKYFITEIRWDLWYRYFLFPLVHLSEW